MVQLLTRQVGYPIEVEIVRGETAADLLRFGAQLDQGTYHVAAVWGLEYGWLRQQYGDLRALALMRQQDAQYYCQIMVRRGAGLNDFAQLKGKHLANYPRMTLMQTVFLQKLLEQQDSSVDAFFGQTTQFPTVTSAINKVHKGIADCVVVDTILYSRHIANQPNINLAVIQPVQPMPQSVLIGRRDRTESLRAGLWQDVQEKLSQIHTTPQGRQCVDFWRIERFTLPNDQYEQLVTKCVREFPITILEREAAVRSR